jgi:hypothetical protein
MPQGMALRLEECVKLTRPSLTIVNFRQVLEIGRGAFAMYSTGSESRRPLSIWNQPM